MSAARLGMAIGAAVLFFLLGPHLLPIITCVVAGFLDLLDGWFARRMGQISRLGEHLDPLADKVLSSVIFIALALFLGNTWVMIMVFLLLLREWGITWLRERLQQRHKVTLPAGRLGKWKVLFQSLFGNGFLLWMSLSPEHHPSDPAFLPTLLLALGLILLLSYLSAFRYMIRLQSASRLKNGELS